jgi:dolichyl-phosphate-mannose-protein mannosyltransferase
VTGDRGGSRPCRILLIAAGLALLWAWTISFTGGFLVEIGRLRISSRNTQNPLLLAIVTCAAAWMLTPRGRRTRTLMAEWSWLAGVLENVFPRLTASQTRRIVAVTAILIAVAVALLGIFRGAFVAGGPDPYGYVSQAHLWLAGIPRVELPDVGVLPDGVPLEALVPLGYRLGPDGASLVPTYSAGFPMQMALMERLGPTGSMFYVMPLLAGVAVWMTYVLGRMIAGRVAGMIATLFVATSPAFLTQLTHMPMSDIPAMAWWAIALVLVPRSSWNSALVAGAAAGAAVLTRPNLAPLVLILGAFLVWDLFTTRVAQRVGIHRLLLFGAALAPGCLAVAYLNNYWYGSAVTSGYGQLAGELYRWEYFWPNISDLSKRIVASQSVLALSAVAAPIFLWRNRSGEEGTTRSRSILVFYAAFAIGTYFCYAFYVPLDTWWTLRFLFPAFPIMFVFLSVVILGATAFLPARSQWLAVLLLVCTITAHAIAFGRTSSSFDSTLEWRYATAGRYIAQRLPERAVFFAMLHGGSVRHYSGRLTVRWDVIPPGLLETVIGHFQRQGYSTFLILDDGERELFVARFTGVTPLAGLDWPPVATMDGVAIYDLARAPN